MHNLEIEYYVQSQDCMRSVRTLPVRLTASVIYLVARRMEDILNK